MGGGRQKTLFFLNGSTLLQLIVGRKLADPGQGVKAYWSALNRLINKQKVVNIPHSLENGIFVTNA